MHKSAIKMWSCACLPICRVIHTEKQPPLFSDCVTRTWRSFAGLLSAAFHFDIARNSLSSFYPAGSAESLSQHIAFWDSVEHSPWAVPPADKQGSGRSRVGWGETVPAVNMCRGAVLTRRSAVLQYVSQFVILKKNCASHLFTACSVFNLVLYFNRVKACFHIFLLFVIFKWSSWIESQGSLCL